MAYKDKEKNRSYNKQWKEKNREKIKRYQRSHQKAYREKKYKLLIDSILKLSYKDQINYLLNLPGLKRKGIFKRINNKKIEKEVQEKISSAYKERQKELAKIRFYKNLDFVKNWMINQGCSCGENNITKLSFHHLDPQEKERNIRKICDCSHKKVIKELKKGIVKCHNCHIIIHAGTSKQREETLINQYLNKKINHKWKYKNKLVIWEFKKSLFCLKCKTKDPVILLFHHIDGNSKKYKISELFEKSHKKLIQEISKTICLCHNCHEDFHCFYGRQTNQTQLEEYVGKKVIPLKINIQDYLSHIDQKISEFYTLSFSIT